MSGSEGSPYVWWQDTSMVAAFSTGPAPSDTPPDSGGTGFKPRDDEDPPWVLLVAVVILLAVIATAATVIVGAVQAN